MKKQVTMIRVQTASGGSHSYAEEEVSAFAEHLNFCLGDDKDLAYLMPINPNGLDLCKKCSDGKFFYLFFLFFYFFYFLLF